ncbi:MAG: hypothetical protein ACOYS2_03720 [Patescibacteria group bacterium]
MEQPIQKIKQEISEIKERNRKVEADKAWETSVFRMVSILILTYLIASWVMYIINVKEYWLNALIPTLGYFLSTLSLPIVKKWWVKNRWKK